MTDTLKPENPSPRPKIERVRLKKPPREQSAIQFPYGDLNDAIAVAQAIMQAGGVPCDVDQLAATMNQAPTSGNFRLKTATARIFGLVAIVQSKYQLTELGFRAVDSNPLTSRGAKADAFLNVPLYRKAYEEFRGKQLPPRPAALEHAFVGFGVGSKQKGRARQAFDRSAQQAGYFEIGGRDRLVRPNVGDQKIAPETPAEKMRRGGGGDGGGGEIGELHPFIVGLLRTLPKPDAEWEIGARVKWLQTAASIFGLIYRGAGDIKVIAESAVSPAAPSGEPRS